MTKSKTEDDPKSPLELPIYSGVIPDWMNDPIEKIEKFINSLPLSEEKAEDLLATVKQLRESNNSSNGSQQNLQ